jgi:ankyrin repeat protein
MPSVADYFAAIADGDEVILKACLQASPELAGARYPGGDEPGFIGGTGLHVCVQSGTPAMAELLIAAGVDLEARSGEGRTALHDAIEYGQHEILEILLAHGAHVDICSAAILGCNERVQELLDEDPERVNDRSTHLSPLGWAAYGNQAETARLLLDRGARMDDGELLCAASVGHVEVAQVLIEDHVDINAIHGGAGCAALHAGVVMRYTDDSTPFISMLLAAGADVNLPTPHGLTALQIAEECARRQDESPPAGGEGDEPRRKNFAGVIALLREATSGIT